MKPQKIKHYNLVLRTPQPHEELLEEVKAHPLNSKRTVIKHINDITLLFNQQRLSKLGHDGITNFLNALQPRSDSLSKLRAKCTDDELIQLCKSRYIQSASELLAWSDYLNRNYESLLNSLNSESEAAPASEPASDDSVSD